MSLLWNRNPETNVVGYRVHVGRVSRGYDSVLDIGNFTFAEVPTSPGMNFFAVTAYDSDGLESGYSDEVTVTDGPLNIPPLAGPDNYSTPKNLTLNVTAPGVLANDSDAEGQPLSAVLVTGPARGSLILNASGGFTYTPDLNYTGPDSFTYQCSDGLAASSAMTVLINVTPESPINTAPVAQNDAYTLAKNTTLNVSGAGVLANDSDADGQPLRAELVNAPNHGAFTLNVSGSFSYTPRSDFTGSDSFRYQASDGLTSTLAIVTLTVTGISLSNSPPVPQPDGYVTARNTPLSINFASGVLANDFDVDGQPLSVVQYGSPARGNVSLFSDGSFTYEPTNNFTGTDSFGYRALDGLAISAPVTVTITITGAPPANVAPVAVADVYPVVKNTALTVATAGVLANDSDADAHPLTAVLVSGPAQGALILNANGSFTFTPATGYAGSDSFVYRAHDGMASSANATVTLSILNTAPVAQSDAYVTRKNIGLNIAAGSGLLINDTDANADPLTASVVSAPAHGALALNANGSFTFTPAANYVGGDSFTYRASDGAAFSAATTVTLSINNSNGAPAALSDAYALAKNTVLTIPASGLLANDFDAEGDALSAVLVSSPARGVLNLNANGGFTFTPTANYVGADSFTYRATDGSASSANTIVSLSITNTAPVAQADSYSTAKNLPLFIAASGVLGNDSDAEGNSLTAALVSGPARGSLSLGANGGFTFTPTAGYAGSDSFTYRAHDGTASSATTTVSIAITNIAPVANADSYAASKNIGLTVTAGSGVLADDTDANGDPLTASVLTAPVHGTLTLNANGGFTFSPTANYVGPDSFTYRAGDGSAFSQPATVTLTINNSNGAPVALAESYTLAKNTVLTIAADGVLANDTDPDGDALTATRISGPTRGVLSLDGNGGFTYAPTAGYTGSDSFTYRATDGLASSVSTTVALSITNTAPAAATDNYITSKNIGLTVAAGAGLLVNDTDANGDALTASVVTPPAHGSLTLSANGGFTFRPTANYVGADSFTYRVSDGAAFSVPATVTFTINNSNGAPVAVSENYALAKNTALTIPALGVLANDSDGDGDPLSAVLVSGPVNGALTLNANGSFTFAPTAGYTGTDSFIYRASDGSANSANATANFSITNTAPVANSDSYLASKNVGLRIAAVSGLLADDTDANGDALTASIVTVPPHGTLALNGDGGFTFTPAANYVGPGSFTYRVSDGTAFSAPATVTITINNSNTAPVAVADSHATARNTTLTVAAASGVLANDTDADDDTLGAMLVSPPARGTLVLNADGSLTYTPANNYVGPDSFAYRAYDGTTNSATATVSITVQPPPNVPPLARNENYAATRNTTLTVAPSGVLANDTDADGNALVAVLASGPAHGTVTLNANGGFTYTPVANYTGADAFTYRAQDGLTNSGLASVFITVNLPANTAPVASGESYSTVRNAPLTVGAFMGVLANDTDVDGHALTVTLSIPTANGTLVLAPGGSFLYTPRAGFTGTDGFSYRVSDGLATATAVATLQVTEPPTANVAPVAGVDRYEGIKNEMLLIEAHSGVLVNDTDANGNTLTATLVNSPAHGTLYFNDDGSFFYFPEVNFTGLDSFGYFASDGTNASGTISVTLSINEPPPENSPPAAQPENYAAWKNTPLFVSWISGVLQNDTDVDGDPLVASLVAAPEQGTVTLNWNGGFVFTPAADFVGTVQFAYEADDGTDASVMTLVTVTVSEPTYTNAMPVALSDTYFTTRNTPLDVPATSGVLINDHDSDSAWYVAALLFPPAHGSVTLNLDGSFVYTPVAEFSGQDTFAYEVFDGLDVSAPTMVTITVNDTTAGLAGCPNCFAALDELMAERRAIFAAAIKARLAVPTNSACAQYGVLVFRTLVPQLGPLHDSAANQALAAAGNCVATGLGDELALRFQRAAALAPSKYTRSASNYLNGIVRHLAGVTTSSNNSSRSKLLAAAANAFVRADKSLVAGNLALTSLEGRILACTFVRRGQSSRGTFVFGANTFVVEDSNGVPIKTGTYSYARTAWNTGRLQLAFDQPTLGYQVGVPATWTFTYGRARHKISAVGLRGYFTSP